MPTWADTDWPVGNYKYYPTSFYWIHTRIPHPGPNITSLTEKNRHEQQMKLRENYRKQKGGETDQTNFFSSCILIKPSSRDTPAFERELALESSSLNMCVKETEVNLLLISET